MEKDAKQEVSQSKKITLKTLASCSLEQQTQVIEVRSFTLFSKQLSAMCK
jgi:hypothetical protein